MFFFLFCIQLESHFFFLGLEYSAGEGTNYPPKFDSSPGKLFVFHPLSSEGSALIRWVLNHFLMASRRLEDCYRGVGHWGLEWGCEYLWVCNFYIYKYKSRLKSRSWNLHCLVVYQKSGKFHRQLRREEYLIGSMSKNSATDHKRRKPRSIVKNTS